MDGRIPARDLLPDANVLASRDLFEVREFIAQTYCPHDLRLSDGGSGLDTWLNHRQLGKLGIGAMSYGANVEIDGIEDTGMLLLMQPLAGRAEVTTRDQTLACGTAFASVVDTDALKAMRWSADCVKRVIQIQKAVIDQHATMLAGRPLAGKLRFAEGMPFTPEAAHCWHYASLLFLELAARGEGETTPVLDSVETLFILKLLESQPSSHSELFQPQPCKVAPRQVRRVEHYILENADQPITLEKLVEVSGVSARALFDGFKRFRGTSPMAYLRTVRLQRAHEELKNPPPGASVTDIACRWEFYQFGRFAAQYRQMFGELPSETLRRMH